MRVMKEMLPRRIREGVSLTAAIIRTRLGHTREVSKIVTRYQERFLEEGETPLIVREFKQEVVDAFARSVAGYPVEIKRGILHVVEGDSERNERRFRQTGDDKYREAAQMDARRAQAIQQQLKET